MGNLRVHLLFTDGEDIIHNKKLKAENYDLNDYEEMDLNPLERQIIHEVRIAEEENAELNWRHSTDDGDDMWPEVSDES